MKRHPRTHTATTQRTFKDILAGVATPNAECILKRALAANRLAKSATSGDMRRGAYKVKTDALLNLRRHFPAQVRVREDTMLPLFLLVEYTSPYSNRRSAMHAPIEIFNS